MVVEETWLYLLLLMIEELLYLFSLHLLSTATSPIALPVLLLPMLRLLCITETIKLSVCSYTHLILLYRVGCT